nr:RES family NAD+ phosphorylase [Caulobacter hibisci]
MASFLHVAPGGMRFNGPDLGAWYAAAKLVTAVAEVAHHLRREAVATGAGVLSRQYRVYSARLEGDYLDLRGLRAARPDIYASDDYAAGQVLGEAVRASGGAGILFDSLRHAGGLNVVAHRPRNVQDVVQGDHYDLRVEAGSRRIEARRLAA